MLRACAVLNTQWEVLPTMLGTETGLSKTSFQRGYEGMSGGFPFVQKVSMGYMRGSRYETTWKQIFKENAIVFSLDYD